MIKLFWRAGSWLFCYYTQATPLNQNMSALNLGYADWDFEDGLFLEGHPRNTIDRYRLQMYHYLVFYLSDIETMEGKNLLETGCGRGLGLKYVTDLMKPRLSIGLDISQA